MFIDLYMTLLYYVLYFHMFLHHNLLKIKRILKSVFTEKNSNENRS